MKRSVVVRCQFRVLGSVLAPFPVQRTPYFVLCYQRFCDTPIHLLNKLIGEGIYTLEREKGGFGLRPAPFRMHEDTVTSKTLKENAHLIQIPRFRVPDF